MSQGPLPILLLVLAAGRACFAQFPPPPSSLTVPAQVPLRVEVTRTVALKAGQPFAARLIEPVYGPDQLLLPMGALARGVVASTPAADSKTRLDAKLDGDFTPLRVAVIRLNDIVLPSGAVLPVDAMGGMRNATTISLTQRPAHTSLTGRVKEAIHGKIQQVRDMKHDPHKGDRLKQILYSQLPYHPQRIWAGSSFDAVLTQPLELSAGNVSAPVLPKATEVELTSGTMHARLADGIDSATAKKGEPVTAVLTMPFCNSQGKVMLPTGTALTGLVLQARPARSWGRNGQLRFSFRSVAMPAAGAGHIEGTLSSIQAEKGENVALDSEGGAHAQPDKGRFLAPLVLGVMAAASHDDDGGGGFARQGVTSNGFGLAARVATMASTSRNASTGFAAFAFSKSIYRRYIARGHEVTFPRNTELAIDLAPR